MDFSDYSQHDATGLAELVATKQVTPAELLAAARARAADVNNKIGAIVRTIPEADQQVQGDLTGPFAGVPFLIKDLGQDYKGHPTSGGCRALSALPRRSTPPSCDAGSMPPGHLRQDQHSGVRVQGHHRAGIVWGEP